jgi:sugar/nucleoside kinase (ribokinase family)
MNAKTGRLLCIGECMVELARGSDGDFRLAFGGDTFNTAIYAARMGLKSAYATALGDDPYSNGIVDQAGQEDVDTSLIPRRAGAMPGLYPRTASATFIIGGITPPPAPSSKTKTRRGASLLT